MELTQGTKSSIEMFDFDNGANDEGLSDKVVEVSSFEIEQESDLTLQSTHIASDKQKATLAQEITVGNATFDNSVDIIQRLNIHVGDEILADAAENGIDGVEATLTPFQVVDVQRAREEGGARHVKAIVGSRLLWVVECEFLRIAEHDYLIQGSNGHPVLMEGQAHGLAEGSG